MSPIRHDEIFRMTNYDQGRVQDCIQCAFYGIFPDLEGFSGESWENSVFSSVFHTFPIVNTPKTQSLYSLRLCKDPGHETWQTILSSHGATSGKELAVEVETF